ncbi:MAG: carbon storage regulator CsrA [Campylobacterales bacterium]|nr:carbon storage regulator CsrA [Campylobacterales bacterium]
MLVLARKQDEAIHIGDNVVVKVVSIENGIVKLGIEAPKEISIMRDELIQEIKQSNKAASVKVDALDIAALSKLLRKSEE